MFQLNNCGSFIAIIVVVSAIVFVVSFNAGRYVPGTAAGYGVLVGAVLNYILEPRGTGTLRISYFAKVCTLLTSEKGNHYCTSLLMPTF